MGEFDRRAGFTVRRAHRIHGGTHNRIVQLQAYHELVTSVSLNDCVERAGLFFVRRLRADFLAHDEGLAMLVLEGRAAAADAKAFRAAGIGDFGVFDFERKAKRPGRFNVQVAFSLRVRGGCEDNESDIVRPEKHFPRISANPASRLPPEWGSWNCWCRNGAERTEDIATLSERFMMSARSNRALRNSIQTERGAIQVMNPSATRRMRKRTRNLKRGARLLRYVYHRRRGESDPPPQKG